MYEFNIRSRLWILWTYKIFNERKYPHKISILDDKLDIYKPPSKFCRWKTAEVFHCSSLCRTAQSYSSENILKIIQKIHYSYTNKFNYILQEAQLSPSDRAMRLVSSNLANFHATVQKLLIWQVLTKPMVWSWKFSWRQCVINKPTTVELCISRTCIPTTCCGEIF